MVIRIRAHLLQVVVLTRYPQARLSANSPLVGSFMMVQKKIFELVHASISEHQSSILLVHNRYSSHVLMAPLFKKLYKPLPGLFCFHFTGGFKDFSTSLNLEFKKITAYLAGVFTNKKQIYDNSGYLLVTWHE